MSNVCDKSTKNTKAPRRSLRAFFSPFLREEDGNATVEAVMWMPIFVAIFSLVVDGTAVFNKHSNVLRIMHDANRSFSVGKHASADATMAAIKTNASYISPNMTVDTQVVNGVIYTVAQVPVSDLDVTGLFTGITSATMTINSQHYLEL